MKKIWLSPPHMSGNELKYIHEAFDNNWIAPAFSNYWLTTFIIEGESVSAEDLRIALGKENIEARPLWKPMHLQPVFKNYPFYGSSHSGKLFSKGLSLPSGSNLSPEDKERVVAIVHRVLDSR